MTALRAQVAALEAELAMLRTEHNRTEYLYMCEVKLEGREHRRYGPIGIHHINGHRILHIRIKERNSVHQRIVAGKPHGAVPNFLECKSVYFRENENCWVCKSVLDDAGIILP